MQIGLDFGTTNSGAAFYDGERPRFFTLDPAGPRPTVIRSLLYITREHEVWTGREAMARYSSENTGRPSKLVKQRVGEIETVLSDPGSVKGYPAEVTRYVQDVYVLVDALTPGRLLRSLKSGLAGSYQGSTLFGRFYSLESLIAIYLAELRRRVEAEAGRPVEGVVLGRPVHFVGSEGETDDRRAEGRLRAAAEMAGFREIRFELEPVAAALHYELTAGRPEKVVVFDLGGGTLDLTVMALGGREKRRVYSSGGLGVAGELFDRRIIEGLLLDHFGRGSTWGEAQQPFPSRYTEALLDPEALVALVRPETLRFLQRVRLSSSAPRQIRALESLLVNNYGAQLYEEVERAKIGLSQSRFEEIRLQGEAIDLWQLISRSQFEALIASELERLERCLRETVAASGWGLEEMDAVVCTGGASQTPCLLAMLGRVVGPEKVRVSDVFGGVAAGLAVRAAGG